MIPSIFTNHDMDDGSNTYGVPRATFSLMAQCVDALCGFREVTLAEIGNLDGARKGCGVTIWSGRFQHRIEIWGKTVTLAIMPMDGITSIEVFTAEASEYPSWLRLQHLVMACEGYANNFDDAVATLRKHGINPETGLAE